MAQLIVRNIEDDVRDKLREMAKRHGRSMEEEVRDILRAATVNGTAKQDEPGLGTRIAARFTGHGLREGEEIKEWRGNPVRPAKFDE